PPARSLPEPDEDAPPRRPRMQVWTWRTIYHAGLPTLLFVVAGYAVVAAALSCLIPASTPFRLLLCLLPGPIVGLLAGVLLGVHEARWRVGKGSRVVDRPLPSGPGPFPPLSGATDPRITDRPGAVAPVRLPVWHVSQLVVPHGPITAV